MVAPRDARTERNLMTARERIVSEIMQTEVFSVKASDRLNSDGTLLGLVTKSDLVRATLL